MRYPRAYPGARWGAAHVGGNKMTGRGLREEGAGATAVFLPDTQTNPPASLSQRLPPEALIRNSGDRDT